MAVILIIMTVISVFSIVPITANAAGVAFTTTNHTYQGYGGNFTATKNDQRINTILFLLILTLYCRIFQSMLLISLI